MLGVIPWELVMFEVFGAVCFGAGYWIKARGIAGIVRDFEDVKTDIENLKAKVNVTPVAPVV